MTEVQQVPETLTPQGLSPQSSPGDILNWPMLKIVYRTDPNRVARRTAESASSSQTPAVRKRRFRGQDPPRVLGAGPPRQKPVMQRASNRETRTQ